LTDFLTHQLSVQRSVQLGLNAGSEYIEQLTATYSISWSMTQHTALGALLGYENGTQPLQEGLFFVNENYYRVGFGPSFSWQLTDKLSSSLACTHWERHSNLPERGYIDNNVTLLLNYRF
jgi:hypothetical protein